MSETHLLRPRAAAPLLATSGLALVVAQGVLPVIPSTVSGQVQAITAHRGAEVVSAAAFVLAAALLTWGLLAINARSFGRGRRVARVGLLLSAFGAFWLIGGRATYNLFEVAITGSQPLSVAVSVTQSVTDSGAFAVLLISLAAFVVGPVVLGIGLWRAGVSAWWPPAAWLLGAVVVESTEASLRWGPAIGMLGLAAALIAWGRAVAASDRDGSVELDQMSRV